MTHPEDLFADYVDGALQEPQRAVVVAHLEVCSSCREEVALAGRGLTALASLQDEQVPFGVTGPVLAEAGRRYERRRLVIWGRLQWAAGAAAAAALVVVVALNLGTDEGPGQDVAREEAAPVQAGDAGGAQVPEAGSASIHQFQGLERQEGVDYDDAGILSLAEDAVPIVTGQASAATDPSAFSAADEALVCVERSGAPTVGDPRDVLIRLLQAEYAGTPAYIAIYAEGPGAGQPPDRVVVWAVAVKDCRILTTASLRF